MDLSLILPAFFAGILTFLAPCTLPLLPGYLAFISGIPVGAADQSRKPILKNALLFVLGFSLIFIGLGLLIGLFGSLLGPYRLGLTRIAGLFVIFFGLIMLEVVKLPVLARGGGLPVGGLSGRGKPLSSFLLGAAFASGWTPCIGPVLASVLALAAAKATVIQGALLLGVFSSGLAIPFLLVAAIGSSGPVIKRLMPHLRTISIIGGLFFIGLGIMLVLDRLSLLIGWGFRLLRFLNYERIVDYL